MDICRLTNKIILCFSLLLYAALAEANIYNANPTTYLTILASLKAGDNLVLDAGTYREGLPVYNLNGTVDKPIVIKGPEGSDRAVFNGSNSWNTVRIRNSSYIKILNLELNGLGKAGDGVNADGGGDWAHHITIENFLIHGYDADQSVVGISTNGCTTWDWVIRRNIIDGAGTGMYLGNSPGDNPFIKGVIEYNVISNTIGYNIEIKHQNSRPNLIGIPTAISKTVIRHNVFTKGSNSSNGAYARPNLLVGHLPLSGTGSQDVYEIYGNFFYHNPSEALFQGEGNIAFYNNLMVNKYNSAVNIQPHNDKPRMISIFNNTIVSSASGIKISGGEAGYSQTAIGNAVFAASPINGGSQQYNITDSYANSASYLNNPTGNVGTLDLYPKNNMLTDVTISNSLFSGFTDSDRDFNGDIKNWIFRGAYSGEGTNPGWVLRIEEKPNNNNNGADSIPPLSPSNLIIN